MNTLFKVLSFMDRTWFRFMFGCLLMGTLFVPASNVTLRFLLLLLEDVLNRDFNGNYITLVYVTGALTLCWLSQVVAFAGGFYHKALLDIGSRLWVRIKAK